MDRLKNCPFCGAVAKMNRVSTAKFKVIANHDHECIFCYLGYIMWFETEDEAVEAWNRRSLPGDIEHDIETVIDTLIEVGNGVTEEDLHHAADILLYIRDHM